MSDSEGTPEPDAREAPLPRSIWLLSEARRSTLAAAVGFAISYGGLLWVASRSEAFRGVFQADRAAISLFSVVIAWTMFCAIHVALTWLTFRDLSGSELRRAARADPAWRNRNRKGRRARLARILVGYGPSSWASNVAALALVAVVAMVLQPALRQIPAVLLLALLMVALSWIDVVLVYALHYLRTDRDGALVFPGEPPERLLDYVYFAAGVQATFGSTDVEVRTRDMRDVVLSQSLLAFMFNTVIIAMVISLLLGIR